MHPLEPRAINAHVKEKRAKGQGVLDAGATNARKPKWLTRKPGVPMPRLAVRQSLGLKPQEPPRTTR